MAIDLSPKNTKSKNLPTIILGIDSSSTGIAWTQLVDGKMTDQGKIKLNMIKLPRDKLANLYVAWRKLILNTKPDVIYIEQSIFVKSPATFRLLSMIVGSLICVAAGEGFRCEVVEPATWKAFYKYKNLSRVFVDTAKKKIGIAEANKLCDRLRKSQTWRVIKHNFPDEADQSIADTDHDIADSWAIALYGYVQETGPIALEISDSIRIDQEELARLGLKL